MTFIGFYMINEKFGKRKKIQKEYCKISDNKNEFYSSITRFNENFEFYYRLQNLCYEEEFEEFLNFLSTPLPVCLRVNKSHPLYLLVLFILNRFSKIRSDEDNFPELFKETTLNEKYISFIMYNYSRSTIKKNIMLKEVYDFIIVQDEYGTISSQELVSMLPCICLDIKPNCSILDICAAPGSKSMQILDEILYSDDNLIGYSLKNNLFIANDINMKRIDTLSTRINRIPSPSTLITCIDASFFPKFIHKISGNFFQFDSILVDVPCTSDGTIRKNIDIWMNWKVNKALHLHKKQISIVSRAFNILKDGGRLVYSTCSLNPIENEAVICTILERFPESKLIYPSELENNLKFSAGLKTWNVCLSTEDNNLKVYDSYETVPNNYIQVLSKSMFPTKKWIENEYYKYCFRILPNMNNTGGFFFAIITKEVRSKKIFNKFKHENKDFDFNNHYEYINSENWFKISNFFGFNCEKNPDYTNFPIEIQRHFNNIQKIGESNFLTKKNCKNKIFLINKNILDLLREYDVGIDLKFFGVRAFEYFKGQISGNSICTWRITQIASSYLIRFIKKRIIFASISVLDLISNEKRDIKGNDILNLINNNEIIGTKELCFKDDELESGCILVVITPSNIIKYSGNKKINPKFQEFKQGIILSAIIYQDFGINFFISKNQLESMKKLVFYEYIVSINK